ncbi:MAG: Predicted membrane protein, partial [uncultured Sphingomonadaceae bacterium]
ASIFHGNAAAFPGLFRSGHCVGCRLPAALRGRDPASGIHADPRRQHGRGSAAYRHLPRLLRAGGDGDRAFGQHSRHAAVGRGGGDRTAGSVLRDRAIAVQDGVPADHRAMHGFGHIRGRDRAWDRHPSSRVHGTL